MPQYGEGGEQEAQGEYGYGKLHGLLLRRVSGLINASTFQHRFHTGRGVGLA